MTGEGSPMTFGALLIVAFIALTRLQRVVWMIHRLALAAIVAALAWALARGAL